MNIPDHIFESLETIFWVIILKFFATDVNPVIFDQGSGMEKIRIRDKGSATLSRHRPRFLMTIKFRRWLAPCLFEPPKKAANNCFISFLFWPTSASLDPDPLGTKPVYSGSNPSLGLYPQFCLPKHTVP
jgi:hypothetical protein